MGNKLEQPSVFVCFCSNLDHNDTIMNWRALGLERVSSLANANVWPWKLVFLKFRCFALFQTSTLDFLQAAILAPLSYINFRCFLTRMILFPLTIWLTFIGKSGKEKTILLWPLEFPSQPSQPFWPKQLWLSWFVSPLYFFIFSSFAMKWAKHD